MRILVAVSHHWQMHKHMRRNVHSAYTHPLYPMVACCSEIEVNAINNKRTSSNMQF